VADEIERSGSGAPIWRHQARDREFELATGDREAIEMIGEHVARHVGRPESVFHELVSDLVHLDVHLVEPTPERNYYTLVTSGMSDRPMAAPEPYRELNYAELLICLPPTWQLNQEAFKDESNYWPIRWLKMLARLPHEYDTWLFEAHTVPNGDPARPFAANTELCCALLRRPVLFGTDFQTLRVSDEKAIHFLALVPLYREEMEFKLAEGYDSLLELLEPAGVTELLDVRRANVCKKGKRPRR
jgi:hypothetical protein